MLQQAASLKSPDDAIAMINDGVTQKALPMQAAALLGRMVTSDPQWQIKLMMGIADPTKMAEMLKPHLQTVNAGNANVQQVVNPLTGAVTETGRTKIFQSPDNAATVGASLANAAALRDQAQATRDAANIQTGFANETSLRKEFEGLPEVKNYKQAYPAFAAIKDAVSRNTTQSDINIVYGLAKLYDPTSVVREGEYATVANSPNIPERIKGYAQYLAGGGKLSPETKKQIMAEAEGRIGTYKTEADKARSSYEGIAKQRGMKPEAVFQAMGDAPAGAVQPGATGGLTPAEAEELKQLRARFGRGK